MNHSTGADLIISSPCIIGEGAVIERLRRNIDLELDPLLVNSAFIYEEAKRAALETIVKARLNRAYDLFLQTAPGNSYADRESLASRPFMKFFLDRSGNRS